MSYKNLEDKFSKNEIVILDGGNGGELERIGAPMDGKLWCGRCSMENPHLVSKVHESYIAAGADVITTNTYATPPIAMKDAGLEDKVEEWNKQGVRLARKAAESAPRDIAVAGSVSTYGSWRKYGVERLRPGFDQQIRILVEAGVDLIILETLASEPEIVESALESTFEIDIPVWLSVSCAKNKISGNLMHGVEESIEHDSGSLHFELFSKIISDISKKHSGPILVMHSDLKVTNGAVKELKSNHDGIIGAYPNAGFWEKPSWKFVDQITPESYLKEAEGWVSNGAQIVGGCCGVGPELIESLSQLNNR